MINSTPPSTRTALRTLLIVILVVVGVLIYAYGWKTTDISLEEVRDPERTEQVQRALTELFSPNIFDRQVRNERVYVDLIYGCPAGDGAEAAKAPVSLYALDVDEELDEERRIIAVTRREDQTPKADDAPYVIVPGCVEGDEAITVEGFNFRPNSFGDIQIFREAGQSLPFELAAADREGNENRFAIDDTGHFKVKATVPRGRGLNDTSQLLLIRARWFVGPLRLSATTNTVIEKMLETIFLALMATTLAVPLSVIISFLAARNLMKQVRMPLGNILIGFILLPVGGVLGYLLFTPLGRLGFDWGSKLYAGIIAAIAAVILFLAASRLAARLALTGALARLRGLIMGILLLVAIVFIYGALGGICRELSDRLADTEAGVLTSLLDSLAQFLLTIGDLVDLTIGIIAAIGGAFLLASFAASATAGWMRYVQGATSHLLGAILGFLSGAILLAFTAWIGTLAVLLGLLTGIVAAIMGGQVAILIYRRLSYSGAQEERPGTGSSALGMAALLYFLLLAIAGSAVLLAALDVYTEFLAWELAVIGGILALIIGAAFVYLTRRRAAALKTDDETPSGDQLARLIIVTSGALIAFAAAWVLLDLVRIVDERQPAEFTWDLGLFSVRIYIAKAALLGAVLGGIAGGISGTQVPFPVGMSVYNTSRTILNALRSIEPLIMGIVFVIWVGIGPFAGVLALTLHSIASLGKLYSEQVESIDPGPIEAITATGANRLQTIIYGVVPQIVPPYIAFTMYRWDINVRMSTIIGFVGGGGIGFLLQQQINLLRYQQAGVAVLAIAIVVSILDYASAWIREKIV